MMLIKRLRKRQGRWWADSDKEKYEPQPLAQTTAHWDLSFGGRTQEMKYA